MSDSAETTLQVQTSGSMVSSYTKSTSTTHGAGGFPGCQSQRIVVLREAAPIHASSHAPSFSNPCGNVAIARAYRSFLSRVGSCCSQRRRRSLAVMAWMEPRGTTIATQRAKCVSAAVETRPIGAQATASHGLPVGEAAASPHKKLDALHWQNRASLALGALQTLGSCCSSTQLMDLLTVQGVSACTLDTMI